LQHRWRLVLGAATDVLEGAPTASLMTVHSAKGLEFDSVVLVEPAAIVAGEATRATGLRRLYVVLTRAVSRLAVLHDEPLPPELHPAIPS